MRNLLFKGVGLISVVYLAAVVGESVAHNEIVGLDYHVVAAYLVEYLLGNMYRRGLVLNDDTWLQCTVVHYGVASPAHAVELDLHLIGHERLGKSFVFDEEVYEMLAHPFLGGQRDILLAYDVEDERLAVFLH